ncbi:glycosyltransferase family 2 protein [Camelimonas abortus]
MSSPAASPTQLDVVIVNWNAGALLGECLDALAASTIAAALHVIVVDNASRDGSWAACVARRDLRVSLIRNPDNRGFGAACNQGAAAGDAPYLLFLNPDTRVFPDTLEAALAFARRPFGGAPPGAVGVIHVDDRGEAQRTCASQPTAGRLLGRALALDRIAPRLAPPLFMTGWDHLDTRAVAQVMGAFLLMERALFERLGGFDARYFVYYEDMDLCLRVAAAGRPVVHFAGARTWHKTQGTTAQVRDRRLFYFWRSEMTFAARHFGAATAWLLLPAYMFVQTPLRVLQAALRGQPGEWRQPLRALGLLLQALPDLRRRIRAAGAARRGG